MGSLFMAPYLRKTGVRLRNYFSSAAVESKDKSDSGIIEFSYLRNVHEILEQFLG